MSAAPWREGRKSGREHGEERVDSAVATDKFLGREGGQAKRISLRKVGESMSG